MARKTPEIPGSSLADIAFLLLIFFLVTTTMDIDMGITRKLPPPPKEETEIPDIKERNVFKILINKNDRLLVEDKPGNIRTLREKVKDFVDNPYGKENLSVQKTKTIEHLGKVEVSEGVISLKNDRGTSYEMYIKVQNELAAAFNELKNDLAKEKFGIKYEDISNQKYIDAIDEAIPVAISEAEPENVGG